MSHKWCCHMRRGVEETRNCAEPSLWAHPSSQRVKQGLALLRWWNIILFIACRIVRTKGYVFVTDEPKEDLNWIPFFNCYSFAEIFIQARTLRIDIAVFISEFSGLRCASIDIGRIQSIGAVTHHYRSSWMPSERHFESKWVSTKFTFTCATIPSSICWTNSLSAQLYLFMELILYDVEFENEYTCRLLNGSNEKGIDAVHWNQPKRNSPADSVLRLDSTQILWFREIYTSAMHPHYCVIYGTSARVWSGKRRMRILAFSSATLLSISHRAPTAERIPNLCVTCGKVNHRHANSIESDLFVLNLLKYFMVDLCGEHSCSRNGWVGQIWITFERYIIVLWNRNNRNLIKMRYKYDALCQRLPYKWAQPWLYCKDAETFGRIEFK